MITKTLTKFISVSKISCKESISIFQIRNKPLGAVVNAIKLGKYLRLADE